MVAFAFLGGSRKLGNLVAASATMELDHMHEGEVPDKEQAKDDLRLKRLSSDMKRLSLRLSSEHKRHSVGQSHLSNDEMGRLERMVILLTYIVRAAQRISAGTASLVVGDAVFLVAMLFELRELYFFSACAIFGGGAAAMTALIHFLHCSRSLGKRRQLAEPKRALEKTHSSMSNPRSEQGASRKSLDESSSPDVKLILPTSVERSA
eukprot:CAMPEP_0195639464 /NCGR_PEP_ID=MMETSP0815-20121206/25599_1 /TAXON_ID=97485 /ORGANISM="Prymnesium parvum, Strain Texoma1" /LENGTH=206 /DNA_ID=CAMNT_0040782007 /DNA_START=109 /DNA_END=729 /DNA_ORIENTATION=+